jgi:hypothetical protein
MFRPVSQKFQQLGKHCGLFFKPAILLQGFIALHEKQAAEFQMDGAGFRGRGRFVNGQGF